MNAYHSANRVEQQGLADLLPLLEAECSSMVLTHEGALSVRLQRTAGDVLVNDENGRIWGVEFKIEEANLYDNFFLETWSNRHWGKAGWMYYCDADSIWYYFLEERLLYSIPLARLKRWAFGRDSATRRPRIEDFSEKPQRKREQKNDTWGRCVPIDVIQEEVGFKARHKEESGSWTPVLPSDAAPVAVSA